MARRYRLAKAQQCKTVPPAIDVLLHMPEDLGFVLGDVAQLQETTRLALLTDGALERFSRGQLAAWQWGGSVVAEQVVDLARARQLHDYARLYPLVRAAELFARAKVRLPLGGEVP